MQVHCSAVHCTEDIVAAVKASQFVLCILCFVFVNVFYMFFLNMLVLIWNRLSNVLFAAVHSAGKMCRNVFKSTAVTQAQ